ncbi:MAG TPA: C2 domain-containing protein [Myxococcota bacterium]|nr:C2 domain-containing protein [Myxococcota bacterium]
MSLPLSGLLLGLGAPLVGFGCGNDARPSDEAVTAYLDRAGYASPISTGTSQNAPGQPRPGGQNTSPATPSLSPTPPPKAAPAARRLAITVESATGLPDLDSGPGETDPYVLLEVEGTRHKTSVVEGNLEPIWGDTFIFDVAPGVVLNIKLMDEDSLSSDELVGANSLELPTLMVGETQLLDVAFGQGERGTVRLTLTGMSRP